jgi:hypothetical protein
VNCENPGQPNGVGASVGNENTENPKDELAKLKTFADL